MDSRTGNGQSQVEKAEGSAENVNLDQPDPGLSGGNVDPRMERGAGQVSQPDKPIPPTGHDDAGGITNRPLTEDDQSQGRLPERGHDRKQE